MNRIKKGDVVRVISGKERGKEGKVMSFTHGGDRVLIEGLNIIKRHTRPTQTNPQGGIVQKEAGVHISNVQPLTPSGRPTRVAFRVDEAGQKVRFSTKYDENLD